MSDPVLAAEAAYDGGEGPARRATRAQHQLAAAEQEADAAYGEDEADDSNPCPCDAEGAIDSRCAVWGQCVREGDDD